MSKIVIDRSVVEQALEDMEMTINYVQSPTRREDMRDSIEALRAALEQEKSPQNASSALQASCEVPQVTDQTEHFLVLADEEVYCTKQPQVEQETVGEAGSMPGTDGFTMACFRASDVPAGTKLYTNPQPPRQPLTYEQISDLWIKHARSGAYIHAFVQAIERTHGIGGEA